MARKRTVPEQAVDASEMVVPTCYVEDDQVEAAIAEQRQRFTHAIPLGNGCYRTRAFAMSDDR